MKVQWVYIVTDEMLQKSRCEELAGIFHFARPPVVSSRIGNFLTILVISISGNYFHPSK